MKTKTQKLNNIIGQVEGVKRMIEDEAECISVLIQLKAIQSAVGKVAEELMSEKLETCLQGMSQKDKDLFVNYKKYVKSY